ncbi:NAD-dependent DNA ligase [Marinobacter daepoensis]|jgi:NAD-dependent DNA ligase|uniref:BRCT domain-containing protein n=1 Tax=Marinobacter TaxID=2742 RepID=UPI001C96958C|nr:BRCT domain-containing protein [Marinobacter daepoensis]MBY6032167.1 NAD-dependent DNA ligase [Marinobacter daepoensis]
MRDENGQPLNKRFSSERLTDRKVDQLIGLCEGVLADGSVVQQEAEFLRNWVAKNPELITQWPANVLFARLEEYLEDGVLDSDEEQELLGLLMDITGLHVNEGKTASTLPLCNPQPELDFEGRRFVLTGKFASGTRKECEALIAGLGGQAGGSVSGAVDYLVIGTLVSDQWIHESYGRKIEKAVELRDSGKGVSIVSEECWATAVKNATSS